MEETNVSIQTVHSSVRLKAGALINDCRDMNMRTGWTGSAKVWLSWFWKSYDPVADSHSHGDFQNITDQWFHMKCSEDMPEVSFVLKSQFTFSSSVGSRLELEIWGRWSLCEAFACLQVCLHLYNFFPLIEEHPYFSQSLHDLMFSLAQQNNKSFSKQTWRRGKDLDSSWCFGQWTILVVNFCLWSKRWDSSFS